MSEPIEEWKEFRTSLSDKEKENFDKGLDILLRAAMALSDPMFITKRAKYEVHVDVLETNE